jgi:hypothetical protein
MNEEKFAFTVDMERIVISNDAIEPNTWTGIDDIFLKEWNNDIDLPHQWACFKMFHRGIEKPADDATPEEREEYTKARHEEYDTTNDLFTSANAKRKYLLNGGYNRVFTDAEREKFNEYKKNDSFNDLPTEEQIETVHNLLKEPERRFAESLFNDPEELQHYFYDRLDEQTPDSFQWFNDRLKRNYKLIIADLKRIKDRPEQTEELKQYNTELIKAYQHDLNCCRRTYSQASNYLRIYLSLYLYAAKHAPEKYGEDTLEKFNQAIDKKILSWKIKPGKRTKQLERDSSDRIIHLVQDEMIYTPINHITRQYLEHYPNKRNTKHNPESGKIEVFHNDIASIWTDPGFKRALSVTGKKVFTIIMAASKKSGSDTVYLNRDELAKRCYIDISTKAKRDKFSRDLKGIIQSLGSLCIRSEDRHTAEQVNYFSSTKFDGKTLRAVIGKDYYEKYLPKIPVSQTPESFFMMKGREDLELVLILSMAFQYTQSNNIAKGTNGTIKIQTLVEWGEDVFNTAHWNNRGQEKRCADRYKKALNTLASVRLKNGKPDFQFEFYPRNSDESKPIEDTTPEEFLDGKIRFSFTSINCADRSIEQENDKEKQQNSAHKKQKSI